MGQVMNMNAISFYSCLLACWVATSACQAGVITFVVGEIDPLHHDSYIIQIDDLDTVRLNHARSLITWVQSGAIPTQSPGATIVFANIAAGADGVNRNALSLGEPLWNWRTTGPVNFVDITAEIFDGWPTFVEQDISGWIQNTNGRVGFWGYTVVREISSVPEPSGLVLVCVGLALMGIRFRRNPNSKSSRWPAN